MSSFLLSFVRTIKCISWILSSMHSLFLFLLDVSFFGKACWQSCWELDSEGAYWEELPSTIIGTCNLAGHVGGNAISAGTLTLRSPASAPLISCIVNPKLGVSSTLTGTAGTAGKDELLVNRHTHSI